MITSRQRASQASFRLAAMPVLWSLKPAAAVVLSVFALIGSAGASNVMASDHDGSVEFDTTFLSVNPQERTGLERFSHGNVVAPGVYSVDIWVNDSRVAHDNVRFVAAKEDASAQPCLSRATLQSYGVDFTKIAADRPHDLSGFQTQDCVDIGTAIPDASVDFDFTELRLTLSIPQKYMNNVARGYVPPELWDEGVNAGFVSYNASAYQFKAGAVRSTQGYLGLNAGVNLGSWHVRHQSSETAMTGRSTQFDNVATYLQRDVPKLRSQVVLGDAQTTGDVFDSVAFRGAQIATDDRMLPESLRGYAPVVRGTADTNAHVTVRQNGQVIYETNVSPGPFEIRDLYATGYGGTLDVSVTEADGRVKRFSVPYASVPQLLRPGSTRFAVTAGVLRDESLQTRPAFTQAILQRGLNNLVTLYGGGVTSEGYFAANGGVAFNTKYGALAADVTAARTQVPGQATRQGGSLRLGYSRFIEPTGTNIAVGAYRYSATGYLGLSDAAHMRDFATHGGDVASVDQQRARLQLTVNQNLKDHGSVFATASSQHYWNRQGNDMFYQAGYSNGFKYGTYSITAGRTRSADGALSNEVMLSTTIPLGHSQHAPQLSTNLNTGNGGQNVQTAISGAAGANNQFAYNIYGTGSSGAGGSNVDGGASGSYRAPYAQLTASASGGANSSQVSAGASGSIVAHPGGVTLSQTVGDTFGIVEAKGAQGAAVSGAQGVTVDRRGYAVVPYLTPYSMNTVDLDPKGTSTDIEFESTSERSAPHSGSVVMLKYRTVTGRAALIRAPMAGGEPLPFGANVLDESGRTVGVVAQDSRIFARGVQDNGTLFVTWGEQGQQCSVRYVLPETDKQDMRYAVIESHCLAGAVSTAAIEEHIGASAH